MLKQGREIIETTYAESTGYSQINSYYRGRGNIRRAFIITASSQDSDNAAKPSATSIVKTNCRACIANCEGQ